MIRNNPVMNKRSFILMEEEHQKYIEDELQSTIKGSILSDNIYLGPYYVWQACVVMRVATAIV